MALVDNTTYTGKDLDGFYSVALLTGNTKSLVRQVPNVKYKVKLASLNLGDILQSDSCDVPESGTYTLEQKTLEVCDFAINIPFCAKDYEVNYLSEQLRAGSNVPENFPEGFMGYMMKLIADKISEQTEELFWAGNTAGSPATLCDGLIKKFLADSAVIDCSSPATLSASNIVAELTEVVTAIPVTVRDKSKIKIFISPAAKQFYEFSLLATHPAIYASNNIDLSAKFMGYELVVSNGMPTNTMVAADPMNLWFGCDVVNEENSLTFIDDRNITGQKTARLVTSFKFGVQYGNGSEVVLYGTGA
jgi:hypothetical protein